MVTKGYARSLDCSSYVSLGVPGLGCMHEIALVKRGTVWVVLKILDPSSL